MQGTVVERLVDSCTSVKSKYFFNDLNHFGLPQIYGFCLWEIYILVYVL